MHSRAAPRAGSPLGVPGAVAGSNRQRGLGAPTRRAGSDPQPGDNRAYWRIHPEDPKTRLAGSRDVPAGLRQMLPDCRFWGNWQRRGDNPSASPLPRIKKSGTSHSRGLQVPLGAGALDPAAGPRVAVSAVRHVSGIPGLPSVGIHLVQRLGARRGCYGQTQRSSPCVRPRSRLTSPHNPHASPPTAHGSAHPAHSALSRTAPLAPHNPINSALPHSLRSVSFTPLPLHSPAHSAQPRLSRTAPYCPAHPAQPLSPRTPSKPRFPRLPRIPS